MGKRNFLFTSESVSEGHPDKICDRISDAVVDKYLGADPLSRVAVETLCTTNRIILAGEVRGPGRITHDVLEEVARACVKKIGYEQDGFHWKNANVEIHVHNQSPDIAQGVDATGNKDEGAGDQFVWDFKNPQNALPKTFRQNHTSGVAGHYNVHQYQAGASTDTAWVYAVLADSLGNTRVAAGGAILLLGSQETPASQTPRVIMRTPPAGDQLLVNGDVVKLEWDAFLIDDNTGTEDAYLQTTRSSSTLSQGRTRRSAM